MLVGPRRAAYKEEVGTDGSRYEVHRHHCSPPQNPNPIREGGCSDGKCHRLAVATAPLHDYAITTSAPLHSDVPVRDVIATSPPCVANPP